MTHTIALFSQSDTRARLLSEMLEHWPEVQGVVLKTLSSQLEYTPKALIFGEPQSAPLPSWLADIPSLVLEPPTFWSRFAPLVDHLLSSQESLQPFACGAYVCVPLERTMIDEQGNEIARLTEKEIALLRHLSQAGPDGLSRDVILSDVWGYVDGVDTHTLETHIYRLRQKIDPQPSAPLLLLTTPLGYALAPAPVETKEA